MGYFVTSPHSNYLETLFQIKASSFTTSNANSSTLLPFPPHHKTQPFIFTLTFSRIRASMGSLGGENEGKTKHQPLKNLPLSFAHNGNGSRGNYIVTGHHSETQCGYAIPLCTLSMIGIGDCRCAGAQHSCEWPRCGLYRYV